MFGKNCNCSRNPQMMGGYFDRQPMMGGCCNRQPQMEQCVMEPTITKCVEKEFYHEVPHA